MSKPKNEANWTAKRIKAVLKLVDRDKPDEAPPAELTVEPPGPKWGKPKQGKAKGRGMMNRPRMTRYDFQLRLTAGRAWTSTEERGIEESGPYRTWRGPSAVQQGRQACFLKSGKNTIEAPSWAIMAQRLGLI